MQDNIIKKMLAGGGRMKVWRAFILILVITVIGALIVGGSYYNKAVDVIAARTRDYVKLPHTKDIPFRLGLDLLGGTRLVYKADMSAVNSKDRTNALEGVRDVIERRVNTFGVSEPVVQTNKSGDESQVIVELAGIKDVNEAVKMIGETPLLEFKEQNTEKRSLTADEKKEMDKFNKQAEAKATDVLGKALSGGDFAALARQYSEDSTSKDNGGEISGITVKDAAHTEIYNIASKLKQGETTKDLVKTASGYEIVKLIEKKVKTDSFNNNEPEKEVKAAHLLICYAESKNCESGLSRDEAYAKIKSIKEKATAANFAQLVKENTTEPGGGERGGELGWFSKGMMVKPFEDAVFPQKVGTISYVVDTEFGFHLILKEAERNLEEFKVAHIFVKTKTAEDIIGPQTDWKNTELTGKNLKKAVVQFNPNSGSPEVSLEFDDDGAKKFADVTGRNINKPVAIYLDNYPISTPTVNEKITGGKAVITGNFNIKEAKLLAQRLNAGALPVPIVLINQQTVGASLGAESISASYKAGLIGFILVAVFMILFYRLPGFLSVLALAVYSILVLAVFKIWPVTLSLAGLAGFIISIGMAVDANILIFSRLREEIRRGKPLDSALEEGFMRAWPSIRDSNSMTIITCIILIIFSTSVVKGFAITLLIGVLASMFSAIVITRNFLKLIPASWLKNHSLLIGLTDKKD